MTLHRAPKNLRLPNGNDSKLKIKLVWNSSSSERLPLLSHDGARYMRNLKGKVTVKIMVCSRNRKMRRAGILIIFNIEKKRALSIITISTNHTLHLKLENPAHCCIGKERSSVQVSISKSVWLFFFITSGEHYCSHMTAARYTPPSLKHKTISEFGYLAVDTGEAMTL